MITHSRLTRRVLFGTLAALCAIATAAGATNYFYVGPNNGSWSNPANWSATDGGPGGAGVPGNGDLAILDPSVTKSVTFDGSYSAPGLTDLYLDGKSGATITLNQSANAMVGTVESIGVQGFGVYHQTGGSNTTTSDFHVGQAGGGTGTYLLDNGSLDVGASEYVGEASGQGSSTGNFTQNGGTHVVGDQIKIAFNPGSTGHFTLNDGSVTVNGSGYLLIGYQGTGTFTQTGGSVAAVHMQIAQGATGNASYDLQSGMLTVNGSEAIGAGGIGVFHQTGGTHTMTGNLYLTLDPGSSGTYNLDAGTLNVSGNIENNGTMTEAPGAILNLGGTVLGHGIIQTNGTATIADQTNINTGTVAVAGGAVGAQTLIVGLDAQDPDTHANVPGNGALAVSGGTTTVSGTLGAGNDGTLTGGTGTGTIDVSGGTLNAKTVLLGSAAGGNGTMTLRQTGQIVVGGGLSWNDAIIEGGSLTVLDQPPPAGEDPMLDRSIVGGYLRDGAMHVHGGTVTSPKMRLGPTAGKTGTFDMNAGTVTLGVLGAGNDGTLTGGSGTGSVDISGGTLHVGTVLLGSTAGGSGTMTLRATGQIVVGGGMTWNDLVVEGGALTVLDQPPPAGEDPVLDRSIVGGYLRDGAMTMSGGTVTTPNLKIGVTAGKVGTLTLNGGTLTAANIAAANGAGSVIQFHGGTLVLGGGTVDGGAALGVGDGSSAAKLVVNPGGVAFAHGMSIAANATLAGGGTITGAVTDGGTVSPGLNAGDAATLVVSGAYAQSAAGTLAIDLSSTGFDAVRISGAGTLGGTLVVARTNGYLPAVGQPFTVLVAHPRTGTFATVQGAGVAVSYTDTSAVLTFTGVDVPQPPAEPAVHALALGPIQPNPATSEGAQIAFALPAEGAVSLAVLDVNGRVVRTLADGAYGAGPHSIAWDRRNDAGEAVKPGVYLVRLAAMGRTLSRRLIVL